MELEIISSQDFEINFHPKTIVEEVTQNIRTILSTPKYSIPLNREFGITATMLDDPMPAAKAKLTAEIFELIPRYEPRVTVTNVTYYEDNTGVLKPRVGVKLID